MTRNEIIRMAIEAEFNLYVNDLTEKQYIEVIERFAALVASAEREKCAKVCEDLDAWNMDDPASTAIKAIRARGQA